MASGNSDHKAKFRRWQQLTPPPTRLLSSLVESRLLPLLEIQGFSRVDHLLRLPDQPVSGRTLELERWADSWVDSVCFNFDKYRAPRFQVHLSRRSVSQPHAWIHSGNLVAHPSQYLYFWGRPWLLPSSFWSDSASHRTVARIESYLSEALFFLDSGERGKHISKRT